MPKSKKNRRKSPRQARVDAIEWWLTLLVSIAVTTIIGCESMVIV